MSEDSICLTCAQLAAQIYMNTINSLSGVQAHIANQVAMGYWELTYVSTQEFTVTGSCTLRYQHTYQHFRIPSQNRNDKQLIDFKVWFSGNTLSTCGSLLIDSPEDAAPYLNGGSDGGDGDDGECQSCCPELAGDVAKLKREVIQLRRRVRR